MTERDTNQIENGALNRELETKHSEQGGYRHIRRVRVYSQPEILNWTHGNWHIPRIPNVNVETT